MAEAQRACSSLASTRHTLREGATIQTYVSHAGDKCVELWKAAAQEHDRLADPIKRNYNIWLEHGVIKTALSVFDSKSGRIDGDAAKKLHDLNGQPPQRLVMKKETRRALQAALGNRQSAIPWTVDPALAVAVDRAIERYEDERTPLVALNPIQRLGYLDEYDEITCTADLGDASPPLSNSAKARPHIPLFSAGCAYPIRTTTVMVKRAGKKMNLHGNYDDVQWDGQELAIFIKDNLGTEHVFMEQRLMQPAVKVSIIAPAQRQAYRRLGMDEVTEAVTIEYTLQDLVTHFEIPAVPDVAQRYPDRYQANLMKLAHIQQLANNPHLLA